MNNQQIAETLTSELGLERPPVGVVFVEREPDGIPSVGPAAPSACTFWRRGQSELFYAPAAAHFECPVGAMTMGFDLPPERGPEAEQLVGTMVELGYFGLDEVPHLPAVRQAHSGIVYGPLAALPLPPDAVLVQTTPFQAMVLAEAGGETVLRESPSLAAMGRPACAALARAANDAQATLSLGCIGARTYVELPDDRALLIIPAASLARTVERLPAIAAANRTLAGFHGERKTSFEGQG